MQLPRYRFSIMSDATDNKIASHLAGSLYDMIAADPKTVHPAGEWNTIVITVEKR